MVEYNAFNVQLQQQQLHQQQLAIGVVDTLKAVVDFLIAVVDSVITGVVDSLIAEAGVSDFLIAGVVVDSLIAGTGVDSLIAVILDILIGVVGTLIEVDLGGKVTATVAAMVVLVDMGQVSQLFISFVTFTMTTLQRFRGSWWQ